MNIYFKDYTHITEFINANRGKYSEAQIAAKVKAMLEAECASEFAIDQFMLQAKPMTILGERVIEKCGSLETAYAMIPIIVELFRRNRLNKSADN